VKVYLISGLAADNRVFKNIQLPAGFEAVNLDWIKPLKKESLREYAVRLAERIDTTENFAILGLSMGGMIAVEMANRLHPYKTIIISSVPAFNQLPFYFRLAAKLYLHKLVPVAVIKNGSLLKRLFTTETREEKLMIKEIIRESDPAFIRWALHAILKWDNTKIPQNLIHIHGNRDELLPMRFTRPTHIMIKAGHLMVVNRSEEINEILRSVLISS
jgi:pimeloyl-ACP methyl ester carboxylesterase